MPRPTLTFFNELEGKYLSEVFPITIDFLKALDATVSMGMIDLTDERAAAVRQLNEAGIPVIAWQLLPKSEGYWYNLNNAPQAAAGYQQFKAWTADHGLKWAGIGIDIEPHIEEMNRLVIQHDWTVLPGMIRRLFNRKRLLDALVQYKMLIAQMHADGYRVDSYTMAYMLDEKRAGSTVMQRLTGVIDLDADRDVPMLYSSFMGPSAASMLVSFAQEGLESIGLGSTGGGVDMDRIETGEFRPLTWDELCRDLLIASRYTSDIQIFSLEGCLRQGFLDRLCNFDWDQPITLPDTRRITWTRRGTRAALWAGEHPAWILLGILILQNWVRRED